MDFFATNANCATWWPTLDSMQVAFHLAGEITQVIDSITWVRCASGNVWWMMRWQLGKSLEMLNVAQACILSAKVLYISRFFSNQTFQENLYSNYFCSRCLAPHSMSIYFCKHSSMWWLLYVCFPPSLRRLLPYMSVWKCMQLFSMGSNYCEIVKRLAMSCPLENLEF